MMDTKVDMENDIPTKFVVERAIVPDKKAYPKKSVIMTLSVIGSLIVTLIILLVIENLKGTPSLRQEEKNANA